MGGVVGPCPGVGCDVLDLPVGQRRKSGEDLMQVVLRVDSLTATGFDDHEQDGAALAVFSLGPGHRASIQSISLA
jgi:hypothetical protein